MNVLLDTNVILDVLLHRSPWDSDSVAIWRANDLGVVRAFISSSSLTDIFYISRRTAGRRIAFLAVKECLDDFEICAVGQDELIHAYDLGGTDYEDNLQIACAMKFTLDAIITRDATDFKNSDVTVMSPTEFLKSLNQS